MKTGIYNSSPKGFCGTELLTRVVVREAAAVPVLTKAGPFVENLRRWLLLFVKCRLFSARLTDKYVITRQPEQCLHGFGSEDMAEANIPVTSSMGNAYLQQLCRSWRPLIHAPCSPMFFRSAMRVTYSLGVISLLQCHMTCSWFCIAAGIAECGSWPCAFMFFVSMCATVCPVRSALLSPSTVMMSLPSVCSSPKCSHLDFVCVYAQRTAAR